MAAQIGKSRGSEHCPLKDNKFVVKKPLLNNNGNTFCLQSKSLRGQQVYQTIVLRNEYVLNKNLVLQGRQIHFVLNANL